MTIAAGFVCREGILLCADTEQTDWAMKLHGSKVGHFQFPGGQLAYAYSGNTRFAFSAIHKCRKELESGVTGDALAHIETILDVEFRRNAFEHPDYSKDKAGIGYQFILALRIEDAPFRMYVTTETAIHQVSEYDCIGFGEYLAHYLIRPWWVGGLPIHSVLSMAAYALTGTKEYVPGCGGVLVYLVLMHDGRVGVLTSHHPGASENVERFAKGYDAAAQYLLKEMASEISTDEQFEHYLKHVWSEQIMETRRRWTRTRQQREADFASRNPNLAPNQVIAACRQLSMGLIPDQLPSPELPGGTDES
jgi:hypothetical protein